MHKGMAVTCKARSFFGCPIQNLGNGSHHIKKGKIKQNAMSGPPLKNNARKEIDSLKSMRTKNKTQNIDNQLKNLKRELASLIGESSTLEIEKKNNNNNKNDNGRYHLLAKDVKELPKVAPSGTKQVHKSYEKNISYSGGQVDVNPQHELQRQKKAADKRSDKKEFTDCLDSRLCSFRESDYSNGNKGKNITAAKNFIPDLVDDDESDVEDCKMTSRARGLLYESFVLKAYPRYKPVQDVSSLSINLNKRKNIERKASEEPLPKRSKPSDRRPENNAAKALIIEDSSDSEVEVIDIDDDDLSCSSLESDLVDDEKEKAKVVEIIGKEPMPVKQTPQKGNSCSKKGVWECPICFEQNTGQEVVTTMCGHVFCKKCLNDYYITYTKSCPTCRTDLRDKPVITLFNF